MEELLHRVTTGALTTKGGGRRREGEERGRGAGEDKEEREGKEVDEGGREENKDSSGIDSRSCVAILGRKVERGDAVRVRD